jgi:hypothetical protein
VFEAFEAFEALEVLGMLGELGTYISSTRLLDDASGDITT